MTRLDLARSELGDLTGIVRAFEAAHLEVWSAEWMSLQSLLRRQTELVHEIATLEGTSEVEIKLLGGAERDHAVDASFLGDFIGQVQATVASIVKTIMHGEIGERGPLPEDVLAASALRVAPAAAGSFIINMEGPRRAARRSLDGEEELPPFDEAVDRVLTVIDAAAAGMEAEALRLAVADMGNHRAIQNLSVLTQSLANTGTSAVIVQRSPFEEAPREVRLQAAVAAQLHEVLSRTHQTVSIVHETGKLTGVRWTRGTFDLEVPRGQPGGDAVPILEVLSGRIVTDIRDAVRDAFDQVVRAELERTVTESDADQEERVSYRLIGVVLADGRAGAERLFDEGAEGHLPADA